VVISYRSEAELKRLHRVKRTDRAPAEQLGTEMVQFFQSVDKRQKKFGKIGDCWMQLIPQTLNEHCALESYVRGTLTVIIDSSSHLYEVKQLLLAGLQKQLLIACKSAGLRKINLRPGRWYDGDTDARHRRISFDR
jgi:hypothetical protein